MLKITNIKSKNVGYKSQKEVNSSKGGVRFT